MHTNWFQTSNQNGLFRQRFAEKTNLILKLFLCSLAYLIPTLETLNFEDLHVLE